MSSLSQSPRIYSTEPHNAIKQSILPTLTEWSHFGVSVLNAIVLKYATLKLTVAKLAFSTQMLEWNARSKFKIYGSI